MVHIVDMYPTLANLAHAKLGKNNPFDGVNVWAHITQQKQSPREEIVYHVEAFRAAVRQADWKLIWGTLLPGKLELYALDHDESESTNLATNNPEQVAKLQKRVMDLAHQMTKPLLVTEMLRATFSASPSTTEFHLINDD
jgi:arylsulfatase I/J